MESTVNVTTDERYWVPSGAAVGNPKWTDELVAELKRLIFAEKLSAGKIAKRLGFASRNAVIGKIHRLGLSISGREAPKGLGLSEYAKHQRLLKRQRHRPRVVLVEQPTIIAAPIADLEIPFQQRCSILDLTAFTCRWPVGEPNDTNFFYCGGAADLAAGQPYCCQHTNRARRGD